MTPEIDASWVLRTMAAMAAADQRLDAREVSLIQDVYEDLTGQPVDISGVVSAVQRYARLDIVEELATIAGSLTQETKLAILEGACRTSAVNGHISSRERERLKQIAAVLSIREAELNAALIQASGGP